MDSNSFYYFCFLFGSPVNVANVEGNTSVDYAKLKLFFKKALSNYPDEIICVSPAVILETIAHFKNKPQKLDTLYYYFWNVFANNRSVIGFQSYEPFMLAKDKNGNSIFKSFANGNPVSRYINVAFNQKLESEKSLVLIFVYEIFVSLILFFFLKNNDKYRLSIIPEFGKRFASFYSKNIRQTLERVILSDLKNAYLDGKEKELVNKNFENYFSMCSTLVLDALNTLKNEGILENEAYIEITCIFGSGKKVIDKARNWYLHNGGRDFVDIGEPKKVKVIEYTLSQIKENIILQGYSSAQAEYISLMIYDFYENGRLVKKNDTEDFWILFLTSKGYLISYDDRVRQIIRRTNPSNADFINKLSNKSV